MKRFKRYLVVKPLNWQVLSELPGRLRRHQVEISTTSIDIARYPNRLSVDSWADALEDVRRHGTPKVFSVVLTGKREESTGFVLSLDAYVNDADDEPYLSITTSGVADSGLVDDLMEFIGAEPDTQLEPVASRPRTAFIAHRFDAVGEQSADRLARFLSLLGFNVKTGRGFSPQSVAEKVKERVARQAVIFVLLTPGEDTTWLTQESTLGYGTGKPIFVLRDTSTGFKPGLLGDMEYIPFVAPHVDTAFIAVLEGLRELGDRLSDR